MRNELNFNELNKVAGGILFPNRPSNETKKILKPERKLPVPNLVIWPETTTKWPIINIEPDIIV